MPDVTNAHYDKKYFEWQKSAGEFAAWANQSMFIEYISIHNRVLDYGCGGGYLLKNIKCSKKVGVEINPTAAETAIRNGIEIYSSVIDMPDEYVDRVISDNALEHTLHPLNELKALYTKVVSGGKLIFIVPCESISFSYKHGDINKHLYSWSPMSIGNLFNEAGFSVIESKAYIHKWPPKHELIARVGRRKLFDLACRIYGRIERSWFQVRVIAQKGTNSSVNVNSSDQVCRLE